MIIPSSSLFDQSIMTALLEHDPVVHDYQAFFSLLDWSVVEDWQAQQSASCGTQGHPISAYLKAFLIRIREKMTYAYEFAHPNGYRAQIYRCPLYFPQQGEQNCDHPQFTNAKGCVKHINIELGGQMRLFLDRESPLYHAIYTQRTSCERINSQAKELGIERPKVRNAQSVKNLNTLTYLIINVRALDRVKSINKGLLQMS